MNRTGDWIVRSICRTTVWTIMRLKVEGLEKLPKSGACIIAANHLGRLDVFLAYDLLWRKDIIIIIAEKYHQYAAFRWAARQVDGIWLDSQDASLQALRTVLTRLKAGGMLAVSPEGTRSTTQALIKAQHGAAFIAARSGVPVYPAGVTGTEDERVKDRLKRLKRLNVHLVIGDPFRIPPLEPGDRDAQLEQDSDEIMCRIAALLPPAYRGVYQDHPRLKELLIEQGQPAL